MAFEATSARRGLVRTALDAMTGGDRGAGRPRETSISAALRESSTLVSVVVPVFNAERTLAQALSSLASQTHRNCEFICLDDGSTDSSLDIMRGFAARDGRFVVVAKDNEGYGATCNRGIALAHGSWTAILEPDDWVEPDMFASMLAFAGCFRTGADIVKTPYWSHVTDERGRVYRVPCPYKGRVPTSSWPFSIEEHTRLLRHRPSIWSALYRTGFLRENGIRFVEAPGAGWTDNPFLYDTLLACDRIVYLDRAFYNYREETPEQSAAFAREHAQVIFDRWAEMDAIVQHRQVHDRGVLGAHCKRGLNYARLVVDSSFDGGASVRGALEEMVANMDSAIVFSDPEISPANQRLFASLRGIDAPSIDERAWHRSLVADGLASLRNVGLADTVRLARSRRNR